MKRAKPKKKHSLRHGRKLRRLTVLSIGQTTETLDRPYDVYRIRHLQWIREQQGRIAREVAICSD